MEQLTTATDSGRQRQRWALSTHHLGPATGIVLVMISTFAWLTSGASLLVTFVPGAVFVWVLFVHLVRTTQELPAPARFLPAFLVTLAVQFVHFAEEFVTGFPTDFALLYGGDPYDVNLFVVFNMTAYAVFALAAVVAVTQRALGFLLVPALFFLVYGAIANAITHTWWSVMLGGHFPGLFTAQLFWIAGPWALDTLTGGRHRRFLIGFFAVFAVVLVLLLTIFAEPGRLGP